MLDSKHKLFGAPLVATDFTKANLSGLNFENANLIYARMLAANLSETINIIPEQVESAELDRATQLSPYLQINSTGKEKYELKKMISKKNKTYK